jgi:hypothetical protein
MRNFYYSKIHPKLKTVIAHEAASLPIISAAVSILSPRVMVETGTACYGISLLLHESCPKASLYSFDIPDFRKARWSGYKGSGERWAKEVERIGFYRKRVHFIQEDILSGEGNALLIEILKSPKYPKFAYFDNGNKEKEITLYSKYLMKGDILGVHDWGKEVKWENVADHLSPFKPHPLNSIFEEKNCTTRLWIRT